MKIKDIQFKLQGQVSHIRDNECSMTERNWQTMDGVIMSGEEAEFLISYIEEKEKVDVNETKHCSTCKHEDYEMSDQPCFTCNVDFSNWTPKTKDQ